jgi:hypothetical protein
VEDEDLDMQSLALMGESDMKEIGIPKGPRLKILHGIKQQAADRPAGY